MDGNGEILVPAEVEPLAPQTRIKKTPKANGTQQEVFAARLEQARSIRPGWVVKSLGNKSEWPKKGKHCPMREHLELAAKERNPAVPNFKTNQEYVVWLSRNPPSNGVASSSSQANTVTLMKVTFFASLNSMMITLKVFQDLSLFLLNS